MDDVVSHYDNPYVLMSRETGRDITELDHLLQSLTDLLTTPIGSRIDVPEYGSNLPLLLDKPFGAVWRANANYWTVEAILRWEPRLYVYRVIYKMHDSKNGVLTCDIYGIYLLGGQRVAFNNMTLDFKKEGRALRN